MANPLRADQAVDVASAVVGLARAGPGLHPDDVVATAAALAAAVGIVDLHVYLADLDQRILLPLHAADATTPPITIDGTDAGTAFRTQVAQVVPPAPGARTKVWAPLIDSAERLGVIGLRTDGAPTDGDLSEIQAFADQLGELLAAKSAYGDSIVCARRTRAMAPAAELRWSVLPRSPSPDATSPSPGRWRPRTTSPATRSTTPSTATSCASPSSTQSATAWRRPGSPTSPCSGTGTGRRHGFDLRATYAGMDGLLHQQLGIEKFATAQLAELTLSTGRLAWLNAGHPAPILVRDGRCIDLDGPACLPVGLFRLDPSHPVTISDVTLEPGDAVLLFTDGVTEARRWGEEFGRDRLGALAEEALRTGQPCAEVMRWLVHAILEHQGGVLQDDATLLLLAWQGP